MKILRVEFKVWDGSEWSYKNYRISAITEEQLDLAIKEKIQFIEDRTPENLELEFKSIKAKVIEADLEFPIIEII